MKSTEIRDSFLDYFASRGHRTVPSAPLVPHGDATLLFTNAGMVQFKDFFLGVEAPPSRRAVSVQKCLRVSGKHNDLENVGPSPRHHTFFEMLGNFSFGDYFKADAIEMAWELVTKVWGLPVEHLTATVFEEDDEAEALWRRISTLPQDRILRCGAADNFWAMGETGPCGPCSEIFVDINPELPRVSWDEGTNSGRYLEIWNLVFMQYERRADGSLLALPNPSIDTGAGLERVTAVLQGVRSNYDTDLFRPLIEAAATLVGRDYGSDPEADTSLRVIADHLRAVGFLLADGVVPANDGRGYVLRRLLRRAVRHGMRIGFEEPFLHRLLPVLGEVMGNRLYPELGAAREASLASLRAEEDRFLQTVAAGAKQVQEAIEVARRGGITSLDGPTVFRLYDTHGLPIDLIREIAEEERTSLDEAGFELALEGQRTRSRAATAERQARLQAARTAILAGGTPPATAFDGYDEMVGSGTLLRLVRADDHGVAPVQSLDAPAHGVVVLDRSVFYAESGGQVADTGRLRTPHGKARVVDVQKDTSGVFLHTVEVTEGQLIAGEVATLEVDARLRAATEANHTATHLLHAALREVLGDGVRQAGSLVHPERLRFDYTFARPLTEEEKWQIEDRVNEEIRRATPVGIQWTSQKEALAAGAMALFGEKYGERVRTVTVPDFSLELCGGCHVRNTGAIGLFRFGAEKGVASGVRRIEATTAATAFADVRQIEKQALAIAGELGAPLDRAAAEAHNLRTRVRELERELSRVRREALSGGSSAEAEATEVHGLAILVREVADAPAQELRELADTLRDRLPKPGVAILGARTDTKATLVVSVHAEAVGRIHAGALVKQLAALVDGSGGGRADFAQAGGKAPERLSEALSQAPVLVAAALGV